MNLYLGLVHYPVKNKLGELITTSVTNMDIHDISRSCRTFGVKKYFVITPLKAQHDQISTILDHWNSNRQSDYNPDRATALSGVELTSSIQETTHSIIQKEGNPPKLVATGAGLDPYNCDALFLQKHLSLDSFPCLLLFGTGWGLHHSVVESAHYRLKPISSRTNDGYNHLSVRSAVAIYLDRLTR